MDRVGLPVPDLWRRDDLDFAGADQRPDGTAYQRFIQLVEVFKEWEYDQRRMARHSPFRVYDVLFNSILHRANRDLLELARVLGAPTAEIREWLHTGATAFETLLWHPEEGLYHSRDLVSGESIRGHTSSSAAPLFAGVPEAGRAAALAASLFAACPFGEPETCTSMHSCHAAQNGFHASNDWRDPVRVNVNWVIHQGLRNYRLAAPAHRLCCSLLRLAETAGFWEYYHPTELRGLGSPEFSWSAALILDLLGQASGGLRRT